MITKRFFDFEVTPNWWCCVFGDLPYDNNEEFKSVTPEIKDTFKVVSSDDFDSRGNLLSLITESDHVQIGYNIKGYDLIIANAVRQGFMPQQIKMISDMIINPSLAYSTKEHLRLSSFAKKKLGGIMFADLMDDGNGGSLKEKEAILGLNILESNVSFDKEDLTEEDKADLIYYCKQDVYAAMQYYMQVVHPYTLTKLAMGRKFNIPVSTCYSSTNARLVSIALGAKRREYADAEKIEIEIPNRIRQYCYDNFPSKVLEHIRTSTDGLNIKLFDNDVNFGNGGIHSVICEDVYVESDDEYMLVNVDGESYYPSTMIQLGTLSRSVGNPGFFKDIFDERIAIKHIPNPTKEDDDAQMADKLVLNTTFGASGNKWLDLYDPHQCTKTCRVGQIFLGALANKIKTNINSANIVQSNTDGLLVYLRRKDFPILQKLADEWTEVSGINLEYDYVQKIWQKNVNNYLMVYADVPENGKKKGKVKVKGAWLNDSIYRPGYVMLSPLNAFVCAKAAKEFLLKGTNIARYIVNCNDIADFAMVCTKGPTFRGVRQRMADGTEIELFKANRVIATTDMSVGKIYKYKMYKGEIRYNQMPNIPDNCKLVNEDLSTYNMSEIKKELDYVYYINRTFDLLDVDWKQLTPRGLEKIDKFSI